MNTRTPKRTNLVRSILAASAILGCALSAAPAMAQGGGGTGKVVFRDFPMVPLKPANQELGFKAETLEVSLLLPAVQKVREAAAWVQLVGEGWEIAIPVYGRSDRTKMAKIVVWTSETTGANGDSKVLNIQDQWGDIQHLTIPSVEVAVSILLPVRRPEGVIGHSARHTSACQMVLADGSVRPVYIGMLLPAIQKVRE